MSRITDEAIDLYRQMARHEAKAERLRRHISEKMGDPKLDAHRYEEVTRHMQYAVDDVVDRDDITDGTFAQYLSMALSVGRR